MVSDGIDIEREVPNKLRKGEGGLWREVQGELQEDYEEFALFILLFEDSEPKESHLALCAITEPYMAALEPITFTVGYTILTDVFDVSVDTLMNNRAILKAADDPGFAKHALTNARRPVSIFKAQVSGKRPA